MKIKKIHNFQIACYDGIPENLLQWKDIEKYELLEDGYIIAKDIAEENETYCFRLTCDLENSKNRKIETLKSKELICSNISSMINF